MAHDDPFDPDSTDGAAGDAAGASPQPVGHSVHPCNNWVDVIALDEVTGEPIADLPYKVFDVPTGDEVASGTTDGSDVPQSHCIGDEYTELVVFFGEDAAIDEARENIERMQRDRQLAAQHQAEWNGIPAGLAREEFEAQYVALIRRTGRLVSPRIGILEMSWHGWGGIFDHILGGAEYAREEFFRLNIRLCWEEYQLVTGGRDATRGEAFGGGIGNGLTFGFGEEFAAYLDSVMLSDKTYSEILAERRRIQDIERISHPNYFLTGEIVGVIPTIFIPVGGAAAAGARTAATTTGAVVRGAAYSATAGFTLGTIEGFGNARGGFVERMRQGLIAGTFAAVGSLVLAGLGVLVVRGVSRRVLVARIATRPHWRSPAQKDIVAWIGTGIRNHPLRQAYEAAVPDRVGRIAAELTADASDEAAEQIARRASQMRREIGEEFKDVTPSPLIDYIREVNIARYDDPLGPTFDRLLRDKLQAGMTRREAYESIIAGAQRPNPDVDRLLAGFDQWLSGKPPEFIAEHWERLAPQFADDASALRDLMRRTGQ
ncbi:hypothetical protein AADZ90_020855 [Aestuariibius sp. 2305UL40-4]|uniref:hypothetical protein n=1 Tax=Aestuariibius violaceus TaxID=3234132 RepID=UPI00345E144A